MFGESVPEIVFDNLFLVEHHSSPVSVPSGFSVIPLLSHRVYRSHCSVYLTSCVNLPWSHSHTDSSLRMDNQLDPFLPTYSLHLHPQSQQPSHWEIVWLLPLLQQTGCFGPMYHWVYRVQRLQNYVVCTKYTWLETFSCIVGKIQTLWFCAVVWYLCQLSHTVVGILSLQLVLSQVYTWHSILTLSFCY